MADAKALVEVLARAIRARVPFGYGMTDAEAIDYTHAALEALEREGWQCVPKEPTDEILFAMSAGWWQIAKMSSEGVRKTFGPTYAEMLAAAPKP